MRGSGTQAGDREEMQSVSSVHAPITAGNRRIQRAYDDGVVIQRPIPPLDTAAVQALHNPATFREHIGNLSYYTNYLFFFKQEIAAKGWPAVLQEHVFSKTPIAETIFAELFEAAFHPIIHLGFGIEFVTVSSAVRGPRSPR